MSSLEKKRRARATRRGTVEKNLNKIKKLIEDRDEINKLIVIRDTVIDKYNQVKEMDEDIFNLMLEGEDENLETEEETADSFAQEFKLQMNIVNNYISTKEESVSTIMSRSNNVELPKIAIKTFNGEPKNWQFFIDSFECAIGSNESLSEVQKLTYLKNLVTGKAESIIDGISLSNDNYKIALELLKDRYDNKQLQISSHMKSLLEIPEMNTVENVETLRSMYDNIETQIRSLEHLGIKSEMYGPMLVPIVMSKIPSEINLIISRQLDKNDCWEIHQVLSILKKELTAREKNTSS